MAFRCPPMPAGFVKGRMEYVNACNTPVLAGVGTFCETIPETPPS